jgi:hypothetical protein
MSGGWGPTGLWMEAFSWDEIAGLVCLKSAGRGVEILHVCWSPAWHTWGGAWPSGTEIMGVWVSGLAGLRGPGLQSGYCAGLCQPWGYGPADQRSCWPGRHGLAIQSSCRPGGPAPVKPRSCRPVQAWGRGLGEIANVCGFPAWQALSAYLAEIFWVWEVKVWGSTALAGKGAGPEDWRSHGL